ncbi:LuxR C-terminal-related transcriptional regulator [Zunongwangia sp. F260]|uniref:LuxR C-terminal-related transcriptional regulator n=1 Tax=Autumnicola lenta TaxID=3075593 RepID=A0ABU3CHX8_9FLAO|nr:LuxR C-terminal-related transcriptional regulator [Zunongwangia sp. F260]MDT0645953.1 LuxR C-terminal-related transcriptional regulator [Zunongwangia sp. F260]
MDIFKGKFDPEDADSSTDFSKLLTNKEKQIVEELSRGLNAEQIAEEMNLSPHTIKTHRRNILQKTECTNTTELVAKNLINGTISPGLE